MFFKKKKIIPQKKRLQKTPFVLGFFGVGAILTLWVFVVQAMSNLDFQVFDAIQIEKISDNSSTWGKIRILESPDDEPKQDISYILLTGNGWGTHEAPDLTDTLIVAGINKTKETISLLSIPRDLYISFSKNSDEEWRINALYESKLFLWEERAIKVLKDKVGEIIGREIDYYVNLDFQGFIQVVDALWWVDVKLEEGIVDHSFPDGNLWYKTFILRKWSWTLDGEVALMYARSRYSTSDFDRSRRQQEIISSLKEKIWDLGYFKDRKKIIELYDILKTHIKTDMDLSDIVSIWLELTSWESPKTLSFNLNDSCNTVLDSPCGVWGFLYIPLRKFFNGKSVLIPNWATYFDLGMYDELQNFSDFVYNYPEFFDEKIKIDIIDESEEWDIWQELADLLTAYSFTVNSVSQRDTEILLKQSEESEKKFEKSILYYNNIEVDNITLKNLQKVLNIDIEAWNPLENNFSDSQNSPIEIVVRDSDIF